MELPNLKILDEKDKLLHTTSKEVKFPLKENEKKLINDMITYLTMSQIKEYEEKYSLRPGMGLAAIQVGLAKRFFVIVEDLGEGNFKNYIVINPKVLTHSEEQIFVGEGEGCLSVNRPTTGIVPRYARITVEAQDIEGNTYKIRVREDISIAFQHEIDHLNGILFVDKIDKKNPFKNKDMYREI